MIRFLKDDSAKLAAAKNDYALDTPKRYSAYHDAIGQTRTPSGRFLPADKVAAMEDRREGDASGHEGTDFKLSASVT